jgi:hypothetical protein
MINIFSPIINSAKRTWKGEEKFWKVFWLWGVLLYLSVFFGWVYFLITKTTFFGYRLREYSYLSFYILPIMATLFSIIFLKNMNNCKIHLFRKIILISALFFVSFFVLLKCLAIFLLVSFNPYSLMSSEIRIVNSLIIIFLLFFTTFFNYKFYKNLKY